MGINLMGNASCDIMNVILQGNTAGLYLAETANPTVRENTIINSVDFGVYITDDAHPNLGGNGLNRIHDNGQYDLYNNTDNNIMAKRNYWGTMDLDIIAEHIYDYHDDNSLGIVEIKPLWDGNRGATAAMSSGEEEKFIYALRNAFPNPCRGNTTICYSIAEPGYVYLCIYDLSGRLVRTLENGQKDAGIHRLLWDGCDNRSKRISTGVYFTRLIAGDFKFVKKIIMIK
jgi:parallel beta-helix repeat protein